MSREILCIIPARAGSRGLPRKNVRRVAGATLLERAIALAQASQTRRRPWRIIVSTESKSYARRARRAGAEVPFLRPAHLAADDARLSDVIRHALDALDCPADAIVVMLTPTTPLTRPQDVRAALRLYDRGGGVSVASVTEATTSPSWWFCIEGNRLTRPTGDGGSHRVERRQTNGPHVILNGAIYVASAAWLRRHGQFVIPGQTLPLVMPRHRSVDIEDRFDLAVAQMLLEGWP